MKRFFTTFFLLAGVAVSLVISDSFFKTHKQQFAAKDSNMEINKSIDLTEMSFVDLKRNSEQISRSN